jgi:hypothetical protein
MSAHFAFENAIFALAAQTDFLDILSRFFFLFFQKFDCRFYNQKELANIEISLCRDQCIL